MKNQRDENTHLYLVLWYPLGSLAMRWKLSGDRPCKAPSLTGFHMNVLSWADKQRGASLWAQGNSQHKGLWADIKTQRLGPRQAYTIIFCPSLSFYFLLLMMMTEEPRSWIIQWFSLDWLGVVIWVWELKSPLAAELWLNSDVCCRESRGVWQNIGLYELAGHK